jgi:hypothetical protein
MGKAKAIRILELITECTVKADMSAPDEADTKDGRCRKNKARH